VKKLLVGCLIIAVLGAIVFAVGGYFLYRAASPVLENARNYLEGMSELGELEKEIANTAPHAPPESGELTEAQVERFVRVQDSVRAALGQRFNEIEQKYEHLKANAEARKQPSMGEMLSALSDIANVFVQARRFQVNALNQEGFSQAEYSWVRDRIFQAAGMEVTSMVDLKKLEDAVRRGTGVDNIGAPRVPSPNVPEKNRALVKPHLEKMDQWLPLAFFGL
jgi:hypothetical protein